MASMTRSRRRQPTEEQLRKSAEKRDRFKALAKRIGAMSEDERAQIVARCGAIVTCEGRPLSNFNSCLLASQFAAVSVVGGFWQWKRAGRRVKKGETGLCLWIPTKGKAEAEAAGLPAGPADAAINTTDGQPKGANRNNFIMGTVFDITQTEPDTAEEPAAE